MGFVIVIAMLVCALAAVLAAFAADGDNDDQTLNAVQPESGS